MPHAATTVTSWTRVLRRVLDSRGIDARQLFEQAGLDPAALDDPKARYPLSKTTRLWRLAVEATGDPALGLAVASKVGPATFRALSYSLIASRTLQEAFESTVRYFQLVTDAYGLAFTRDGEYYRLAILDRPDAETAPAPEAIDAFVAVIVLFCRSLAGRDFRPLGIFLRRPAPPNLAAFERVLRCELHFAAKRDELWFTRESMERPLETADAELARHNEAILIRDLARSDKLGIKERARALLVEQLPRGEPSAETLARSLSLSLRSLQRRLADEGSSFEALLSDTRCTLALSYLQDPHCAVGEITWLLGFSDASSFARAFKRWTGQSPSAWRAARARQA